jgi:excisionase family DNA binding protein
MVRTTDGASKILDGGMLTVAEASAFLRLSRSKLHELMGAGELAFCKFGRARRIPKRAVEEYAARSLIGA